MSGRSKGEAPVALAMAVDLYAQARKALSHLSPFDTSEDSKVFPTLPSALSSFLSKHSDGSGGGRRKNKKSHGEDHHNPDHTKPSSVSRNVWEETEEYLRPLTLADFDHLFPELPLDSCLSIPILEKKGDEMTSSTISAPEIVMMDIDDAVGKFNDDKSPGKEEAEGDDGGSSMNWLLGTKKRCLLTSERQSKKRKLLGGDAGLERLLLLPHSQQPEASPCCDLCCSGPSGVKYNRLLSCDSCKVSVHQKCYGTHEVPLGVWLCSWCNHLKLMGKRLRRMVSNPV